MDISPAPLDIAASAGRLVAVPRWLPCFLCGAGDWTRRRPRSTGARASSPWTLLRAGPVSLSKPQRQMCVCGPPSRVACRRCNSPRPPNVSSTSESSCRRSYAVNRSEDKYIVSSFVCFDIRDPHPAST